MQAIGTGGAALGLGLLLGLLATPSLADGIEPRWVHSEQAALRYGPLPESELLLRLPRGTELQVAIAPPFAGFCWVHGPLQQGYIACDQLSDSAVARDRAGQGKIPANRRWVLGVAAQLQAEPRPGSAVLAWLAINQAVQLQATEAVDGYCAIRVERSHSGYVACAALAEQTLDSVAMLSPFSVDGHPNPAFDPISAFWLEPGWGRMAAYAQSLAERLPAAQPDAPKRGWPADAALEKMRQRLADGVLQPPAAPLLDWSQIQTQATTALPLAGSTEEPSSSEALLNSPDWQLAGLRTSHWRQAMALWSPHFDGANATLDTLRLVLAITPPPIRGSLFTRESDVAPPGDAQQAARRFGIPLRWQHSPRPLPEAAEAEADYSGAGLYDMLSKTQSLSRPVHRVRLFRDGRLQTAATRLRRTETLWNEVEPPMCEGWSAGFAFGAADPRLWRYGIDIEPQDSLETRVPGSVYEFLLPERFEFTKAAVVRSDQVLDRGHSGFVGAVSLSYDFNRDEVPDLLIWEATGRGPGHLDGETKEDHPWYRLVLVNIGGRWKVLGGDSFSYGCGC